MESSAGGEGRREGRFRGQLRKKLHVASDGVKAGLPYIERNHRCRPNLCCNDCARRASVVSETLQRHTRRVSSPPICLSISVPPRPEGNLSLMMRIQTNFRSPGKARSPRPPVVHFYPTELVAEAWCMLRATDSRKTKCDRTSCFTRVALINPMKDRHGLHPETRRDET